MAAATAAVVPFSCVICFDEFNLKNRQPVVLPCGHTFLCEQCSKRLKRCMECRVPLFYTVPKKPQQAMVSYNRGGGRYSPTPLTPPQLSSTIPTNPHQKQQVPLPIPKNLVLIAMMEAAQMQSQSRNKREEQEEVREESSVTRDEESVDDEDMDLNGVLSGIEMMSGPCGTYAVKESLNFTSSPSKQRVLDGSDSTIIRTGTTESSGDGEVRQACGLEKGSTLQVVSFRNGVAELARGYGSVDANSSNLVKGKMPFRRACCMSLIFCFLSCSRGSSRRVLQTRRHAQHCG